MKKTKIAALMLAASLGATSLCLTACSKEETKKKDKKSKKTEETTVETTEETVPETTVVETEEPEETTAPVVDVVECANEDNEADAKAYELFKAFVASNDFSDDARFSYEQYHFFDEDEVDSRWGLIITEGDDCVAYGIINGEVTSSDAGYGPTSFNAGLDKETFLQLPMMLDIYDSIDELISAEDIEDGTYYGGIICASEDGKFAFGDITDPIYIDEDTFNSLDGASSFKDVDGENYEIADSYDNTLYITDEADNGLYGWFTKLDDGRYIMMTDSDCVVSHHNRYCFIELADDCEINDHFAWLIGGGENDPTVGVNPDEPLTLPNSHYYYSIYTSVFGNVYNGWITGASAMLEPVEIKDGKIVSVTLGWR